MFFDFGFYIVASCACPAYLEGFSERILTVSSCICDSQPELFACMNRGEGRKEYRKRLAMEAQEFEEFAEEMVQMFEDGRLMCGGRFLDLQEAKWVYCRWFRERSCEGEAYRLVGISLEDCFVPEVEEEKPLAPHHGGAFLGYDILGWDIGGFHTYLCNSLQKELMARFCLKPGRLGLLQNSREEVNRFSEAIQGKGEPVVWIPFQVHEYPAEADEAGRGGMGRNG